ncbi:MAG: DUF3784 domain-containing protein [Lachnotalea sp.]
MNIGALSCLIMGSLFAIMLIVFSILKEKASMLISGFNTLTKNERKKYDKVRMSADQRDSFFIWTVVFAIGAIASYIISQYISIVAFAIWLFLFFKDVHMDTEKAFGKYRK